MKPRNLIIIAFALLLVAPLSAQMRMHPSTPPMPPMNPGSGILPAAAAMVTGTVSTVSGNSITIAGGTISIDVSSARIVAQHGAAGTVAAIKPGLTIVAMLSTTSVAAGAVLPATTVVIDERPDVVLSGPVQSVDAAAKTFTVLGQTVSVSSDTSFGGMMNFGQALGLADLAPGTQVMVEADVVSGKLVADDIHVMGRALMQGNVLHGTVKSISATAWVIGIGATDRTVVVNADTKITGTPKVGDTVDVITVIDSANNYVALAIMKSPRSQP